MSIRPESINMGFHTWWVAGIILIVATLSCNKNEKANIPPNIIYILTDDLGYGDLSCYGQKVLNTPHIDQLAKDGMLFTQHYAGSTVCAPSRACLLTGKHSGHISVKGNQPPGQLLLEKEITIPEALKEAGYVSGMIGKWGVGHPPPIDDPLRNGFDEYYGYVNMWHAHNFYPEFLYHNGNRQALQGNETDTSYNYREDLPEGSGVAKTKVTYAPNSLRERAKNFIKRHKADPFFLYLSLNMPHANNEAGYFTGNGMEVPMKIEEEQPAPNYGDYHNRNWPKPEKGFATMITYIDDFVGDVRKQLKELNLNENTILIFTSDNGPHEEGGHKVDFFDSNGPLRGAKRDLYEGGIRVPLIVSWPGHIEAGSKSDYVSAFWDILPTFCDIANVDTPQGIDGISFLPTLIGEPDNQKEHPYLYWEFYEMNGRQAIRKDQWKYVKLNVRNPKVPIILELYNLIDDPLESNNLIKAYPDIANDMEAIMDEAHSPFPGLSLFSMKE